MNKQITAMALALIAVAIVGVNQVNAQTVTVVHNHIHGGHHFRSDFGLGVLASINNPCASLPGTVAIQTTNGITCVSTVNALNDIQGFNEPIIISGFGGHHHFHH